MGNRRRDKGWNVAENDLIGSGMRIVIIPGWYDTVVIFLAYDTERGYREAYGIGQKAIWVPGSSYLRDTEARSAGRCRMGYEKMKSSNVLDDYCLASLTKAMSNLQNRKSIWIQEGKIRTSQYRTRASDTEGCVTWERGISTAKVVK